MLDYEFHIMDNAFLIHRPGITELDKQRAFSDEVNKTNKLLNDKIKPEMEKLYGKRKGCNV